MLKLVECRLCDGDVDDLLCFCYSTGMSSQPGAYQSQPGYNQYPPADQYGQQYMGSGSYPPSRPMYPVYPPDAER